MELDPFNTRRLSAVLPFALAAILVLAPTIARAQDMCVDKAGLTPSSALVGTCAVLAAVNARDSAALTRLMADDFELTAVTGKYCPASKAEMIARWTAAGAPGTTSRSTLTKINRTFETAELAYVTGEIEDRAIMGLTAECSIHTFTDIWAHRGARWAWLQSHESGVRTTPCAAK